MQKKITIGKIGRAHGLSGAVKVQCFYPYFSKICANSTLFIEDQEMTVEKIFAILNDSCVVKFDQIPSLEEAKMLSNAFLIAKLHADYDSYLKLSGLLVVSGDRFIGRVEDIRIFNKTEFLELENDLISINQIKSIRNGKIFL